MIEDMVIDANDPIMTTDFVKEMVRQMRALDTYGIWDNASDAEVLDPFIMTKERKRELPVVGDPDEEVIARLKSFYNGIAVLIEKECGHMAVPLVNMSHEGFGRVLITVGKLVVLDRSLRDVHRFGFESLSKMKDEADKYLAVATTLVGQHPTVAEL